MRIYVLIGVTALAFGLLLGVFGGRLLNSSQESSGQRVVVPHVARITASNAARVLSDRGLQTTLVLRRARGAQTGQVILQRPSGGAVVAPGSTITLIVARH
jgi:beta-lactam-binding protein with PASTA domain